MGLASQETKFVDLSRTTAYETYQYRREGEEYPFVDVSFALQALSRRPSIATDGPYKNAKTSEQSKVTHRERPNSPSHAEYSMNVPAELREEISRLIAEHLFELHKIQEITEQG